MHFAQPLPEPFRATPSWARLLAEVGHQVRTPMNGILGMSQLLLSTGLSRHQRQMAQVVVDSSRNLLELLQDVLDLARVEEGALDLAEEPIDLRALLEDAAWRAGLGAAPGTPPVELWMDPALPRRILGDSRRLGQVLLGTLRHTAKGIEGGRLGLRARRLGDSIHLEAAGKAFGAPMDADLFLPFQPADPTPAAPREGLGQGLFIAREWVERMGGLFGTEGRAGEGSRTWFTLPLREPGRMHAADAPRSGRKPGGDPGSPAIRPAASPAPAPSDARILVVEDNLINQRVFVSMLEHLGYGCRMVSNGQEALDAMAAERFDLVFMDCQMPVMDGYEAVRRARAGKPAHEGVIIAMTAHALDGDREKCLMAGMDDYLAKPISLDSLGQMLAKWLRPAQAG